MIADDHAAFRRRDWVLQAARVRGCGHRARRGTRNARARQRTQRLQTATALRVAGGIEEIVLDTETIRQPRAVRARLRLEQLTHPRKGIGLGEPPLDPALGKPCRKDSRQAGAFVQPHLRAMGRARGLRLIRQHARIGVCVGVTRCAGRHVERLLVGVDRHRARRHDGHVDDLAVAERPTESDGEGCGRVG